MKKSLSKKSAGVKAATKLHDQHLAKVRGYVKNDIKEDKALLRENIRINKDLHRK